MIIFNKFDENIRKPKYYEDVLVIKEYLKKNGNLKKVDDLTISDAWYDFSDIHDAGWLYPHQPWLDMFVDWLDGRDIKTY